MHQRQLSCSLVGQSLVWHFKRTSTRRTKNNIFGFLLGRSSSHCGNTLQARSSSFGMNLCGVQVMWVDMWNDMSFFSNRLGKVELIEMSWINLNWILIHNIVNMFFCLNRIEFRPPADRPGPRSDAARNAHDSRGAAQVPASVPIAKLLIYMTGYLVGFCIRYIYL